MSKFVIDNGFPNHSGQGPYLSGKLVEGNVSVGDKLVINEQIKIPIIAIEHLPFKSHPNTYILTIPREFDDSDALGFKLFELFGRIVELSR